MKSKILIRTFIVLTVVSFIGVLQVNNVSLSAAKDPLSLHNTNSIIIHSANKDENILSYTGYDTSKIEQIIMDFKTYITDTYNNVKNYLDDTKESIVSSYDQIYDFFFN